MPSYIGKWRSPVAHSAGGRAVAGSNPVFPTTSEEPQLIGVGRSCWTDLRLIREEKKITVEEVYAHTKIPLAVLIDFEADGLIGHEQLNDVYLRSLVAAYASSIGVDPGRAGSSFSASRLGVYDGALASEYQDQRENSRVQSAGAPLVRRERRHLRLVTANNNVTRAWRTANWLVVARIPLLVLVLGILLWMVANVSGTMSAINENDGSNSFVGSASRPLSAATPVSVFGDSITVTILARYGILNPLVIQVDGGRRNPYWLEIGESKTVTGRDRFSIRGDIEYMALSVGGADLPFENGGRLRELVLTRESLETLMRATGRD
jgi:hypothetical protein